MVDVKTEIEIMRPIYVVSSYSADPLNAPEWYENIRASAWHQGSALSVGAKMAFQASFLSKDLSYVYEIIEYEPGKKLVMRTADGPFLMETIYQWTAVDDTTTRMTLRNRGNTKGFSRLIAPFMARMMRKANRKDLRKLKNLLEDLSGTEPTSSVAV